MGKNKNLKKPIKLNKVTKLQQKNVQHGSASTDGIDVTKCSANIIGYTSDDDCWLDPILMAMFFPNLSRNFFSRFLTLDLSSKGSAVQSLQASLRVLANNLWKSIGTDKDLAVSIPGSCKLQLPQYFVADIMKSSGDTKQLTKLINDMGPITVFITKLFEKLNIPPYKLSLGNPLSSYILPISGNKIGTQTAMDQKYKFASTPFYLILEVQTNSSIYPNETISVRADDERMYPYELDAMVCSYKGKVISYLRCRNIWYVYDPVNASNEKLLTRIEFDASAQQYQFYSGSAKGYNPGKSASNTFTTEDYFKFYTWNYMRNEDGKTWFFYAPTVVGA